MKKDISELVTKLNYKFQNIDNLTIALTHSSYVNEHTGEKGISNERFEFLGDAVLDLIIGEYFFETQKDVSEGKLSKLRSLVVNEDSLYEVGSTLAVGDYMRFGKGELKLGANKRKSTIADCLEAIIGSIFLDGGYENSKKIVLEIFKNRLVEVEKQKTTSDYKSRLQEVIQKLNGSNIKYVLYDEKGPDNNKSFYTKVLMNGKVLGQGSGSTKKMSEQMAAKAALKKLGE